MPSMRQSKLGTLLHTDDGMKYALSILAAITLVGGFVLACYGNNTGAGITYSVGVFCLIFAFLSRFKRFKGLGIEAELWEEKQEEAAALIDHLRAVGLAMAEPLLTVSGRIGRWDSAFTRRERFDLLDRIAISLRRAGVEESTIAAIRGGFDKSVAFDMLRPVLLAFQKTVNAKLKVIDEELAKFGQPISDIVGFNTVAEKRRTVEAFVPNQAVVNSARIHRMVQ